MPQLKRANLPINPDILVWARERAGVEVEHVASKIGVRPEKVKSWEAGDAFPTPRQGRLLAKQYDRPFLEFFATGRPDVPDTELVPDFRLYSTGPSAAEERPLKKIQSWAEEHRLNALALLEELGEQPQSFPATLKSTVRNDVETVAALARDAIDFPIEEQLEFKTADKSSLPELLRTRIEAIGVLILKENGLAELKARGLCLFADPLPVIVFAKEAPSAQAFTIVHEFAHVMLGTSAIIGAPQSGSKNPTGQRNIESWCNQFAAAFLAPRSALNKLLPKPRRPAESIQQDKLHELARAFSISPHAMLIRLVDIGYVNSSFYWNQMREIFLSEEAKYKGGGRAKYYGRRYITSRGNFYTSLVLEAWSSGAITGHHAAEYMGIKNLQHLKDIREEYRI